MRTLLKFLNKKISVLKSNILEIFNFNLEIKIRLTKSWQVSFSTLKIVTKALHLEHHYILSSLFIILFCFGVRTPMRTYIRTSHCKCPYFKRLKTYDPAFLHLTLLQQYNIKQIKIKITFSDFENNHNPTQSMTDIHQLNN